VGASTMDHLSAFIGRRAVAVNFAMKSPEKDQTGNLKFVNVRAAGWWRMREALAPERIPHVALPPDTRLAADLCAPRYALTARGIQVEDKDDIRKRLGRSPDRGDAVVLAAFRTPLIVERGEDRGEDVRVHRAVSPRSGGSG